MKTNINDYAFWKKEGAIGIPMTNDRFFVFFLQECPNALKSLISSILDVNIMDIKEIQILNPVKPGDTINDKEMILDLLLLMNNSSIINLEMQVENEYNWQERCISYIYRMDDTLTKGQDYSSLRSIIQVGFLNYTLFKDNPEFFSSYELMNTRNGNIFTDKIQIKVVDLSKIDNASNEDVQSGRVLWAKFFNSQNWDDLRALAEEDSIMAEAAEMVHDFIDMDKYKKAMELMHESDRIHRENVRKRLQDENEKLEADKNKLETEKSNLEAEKINLEAENEYLKKLLSDHGITVK